MWPNPQEKSLMENFWSAFDVNIYNNINFF